jgi:hypothetical protein
MCIPNYPQTLVALANKIGGFARQLNNPNHDQQVCEQTQATVIYLFTLKQPLKSLNSRNF